MTGRPCPGRTGGAPGGANCPGARLPCFRPPAPQCEALQRCPARLPNLARGAEARLPEEHPSRGICAARQIWSDPKSPIGHGHHGACASEHTGSMRWLVSLFPQFWARIAIVLPGHRPKINYPPHIQFRWMQDFVVGFPPKCARFAYPSPMDRVGPCKESYQRLAREMICKLTPELRDRPGGRPARGNGPEGAANGTGAGCTHSRHSAGSSLATLLWGASGAAATCSPP